MIVLTSSLTTFTTDDQLNFGISDHKPLPELKKKLTSVIVDRMPIASITTSDYRWYYVQLGGYDRGAIYWLFLRKRNTEVVDADGKMSRRSTYTPDVKSIFMESFFKPACQKLPLRSISRQTNTANFLASDARRTLRILPRIG